MFDLLLALSTALVFTVIKIAAEQGLALARVLQDHLTQADEPQQREAFEKAYQAALGSLGALNERQLALFNHRPFVDAVVVGLLDTSSGLDLGAAAWELPLEEKALKKFFGSLKSTLTRDLYWGELLVRYQELKDDPALEGKLDELAILGGFRVEVSGDGAAALNGGTALGARAVYVRDGNGNIIHTGQGDIRQINTAGGAYVQGDVHVAGGDFVGGDKIVHIHAEASVERGVTELKAYFKALAAECGDLPLGMIDEAFARKEGISLKDVYIDLDVLGVRLDREKELHLLRRELEHPEEKDEEQRVALIKVIARKGAGRMVVLGAAGSGKTTFTNHLTYRLAKAYVDGAAAKDLPKRLQGLLPVRLVLRKAAAHLPLEAACGQGAMLWNALQDDLKVRLGEGAGLAWRLLKEKLLGGECLVLLDGLDEVPEAGRRRACLLEALQGPEGFLKGLPKTQRVVLTARPYAYANPDWQLQGCKVFNLAPLSPQQIGCFVKQWYLSVRGSVNLDLSEAGARAEQLAAVIAERSYLADLATRPLLLTQMAMVHSTRKELPEDRADLYEKTVDLLLVRWQKSGVGDKLRVGGQSVSVDAAPIRSVLAALAYQTHRRQHGAQGAEGPGDIPFGELLACFIKKWPEVSLPDLTAYLENRTGLLVEREPETYCFAHRSFQEYLAACHLLDTSLELSADLRRLVDEDAAWWREVILLAIGKVRQGSLVSALDLLRNTLLPDELEQCPNPSADDWRAAALGGLGLAELRVRERQPDLAELKRNLPRARKWLVGVLEKSTLPVRERVEAGNSLAALGDPRFDMQCCYLPKDEMLGFVRVPGGAFWMGSDPERDPEAKEWKNEQPPHEVDVPEFYIQRYPVTVAQFSTFVEQSRYVPKNMRYLKGVVNHPVVQVTWDDAMAYCAWLENWLREKGPEGLHWRLEQGWRVSLPSEAEWEKATRGADGRIYPWGDESDADKANLEKVIGTTSPVGSFPGGSSPHGILDMSGNVWEWTRSLHRAYLYISQDGRENLQSRSSRVLRGGAFVNNRGYARCAFRNYLSPAVSDYGVGFRVALVSPTFYL
jgi:formylglycine-generating enzyme required for sulfatase activity